MRKVKLFLMLLASFGVFSMAAQNEAEAAVVMDTEDNDVFDQATVFSVGDTINGNIAEKPDSNDVDIYKFTLTEEGRLNLKMTAYMQYNTIIIYNSDGEQLWYTDRNEWNSNTGFLRDEYSIDLLAGTYYLKISGYRDYDSTYYWSTGNYTLETNFVNANSNTYEPNNSFAEANEIILGNTVNGQVAKTATDDYDFFKFNISQDGEVYLKMTAYMQYNTMIIYDNDGNQLWYTDRNEWNSNTGFKSDDYNIDLLAGTYYLKISGYRDYDSTYYWSTGNYTLETNFTSANTNIQEPNNSFAEAKEITLDSEVNGQIAMNDSYDIYKFTMNASDSIDIDMASYMQYYCLNLYDSDGKELWYTDRNEWNSNTYIRKDSHTIALTEGTFYLKVTGYRDYDSTYYWSTGNYTFLISKHQEAVEIKNEEVEESNDNNITDNNIVTAKPKMSKKKLTLKKGRSAYLTVLNATGTIKWKSANKKIATVSSSGLVTAKKKGKTVVTAKVNGKTVKCKITVKK